MPFAHNTCKIDCQMARLKLMFSFFDMVNLCRLGQMVSRSLPVPCYHSIPLVAQSQDT